MVRDVPEGVILGAGEYASFDLQFWQYVGVAFLRRTPRRSRRSLAEPTDNSGRFAVSCESPEPRLHRPRHPTRSASDSPYSTPPTPIHWLPFHCEERSDDPMHASVAGSLQRIQALTPLTELRSNDFPLSRNHQEFNCEAPGKLCLPISTPHAEFSSTSTNPHHYPNHPYHQSELDPDS